MKQHYQSVKGVFNQKDIVTFLPSFLYYRSSIVGIYTVYMSQLKSFWLLWQESFINNLAKVFLLFPHVPTCLSSTREHSN
ncbi:Uncharacterized protein APZ42_028229 [Daphnia magna]|uniref:Uncharacterized protein n=1 Tax=Daphnia magna TaxID=35525 RepID=A0A0P6F6E6_9CRUS|nr:Uncharacterized protein APZ42_028229 [Daphnia magna]